MKRSDRDEVVSQFSGKGLSRNRPICELMMPFHRHYGICAPGNGRLITSAIAINVPIRGLLSVETKEYFLLVVDKIKISKDLFVNSEYHYFQIKPVKSTENNS